MRKSILTFSLLFAACVLSLSAKQKDARLPDEVLSARYVAVVIFGSDGNIMHETPEDRRAVTDVENAFRKWGRYKVTMYPKDAELIIAVRRSGRPNAKVGTRIGTGAPNVSVSGNYAHEDSFLVFRAKTENPTEAPAIWRYLANDALASPSVPAVDKFRKAVEESEKAKP